MSECLEEAEWLIEQWDALAVDDLGAAIGGSRVAIATIAAALYQERMREKMISRLERAARE